MKRLLLILTCLFAGFAAKAQDVPQSERDALVAFYDALDGDYWINKTNWKTSQPVSKWYGVTVASFADGLHVTAINFYSNGLFGEIPPQIKNLKQLKTISLSQDAITNISDEIGTLNQLEKLVLVGPSSNNAIRYLTRLPDSFGNLSLLEELDVSNNSLTDLPPSMSNLKKLKKLNISLNKFTSFPEIVASIITLEDFTCYGNNMASEAITSSFSNLVNIKKLFFPESNLRIVDPLFFSKMSKLEYLYLGDTETPFYLDLSKNPQLYFIEITNKNLQIANIKNGNNALLNTSWNSSTLGAFSGSLKCVEVDNPTRATAGVAPYQNIRFRFLNDIKNFQSDCSSYLSTNNVKVSDIKIQNPVKDLLTIPTPEKIEKIEIYSMAGQLLKTSKSNISNVSDLPRGVYMLNVVTEKGIITKKIIKD